MHKLLRIAVGLAVIGVSCYGALRAINWFIHSLNELKPEVGAAIVAGAITVVTSVYIASYNARKARERIAVEANREIKAKAYMQFMDTIIKVLKNTKSDEAGSGLPREELEEFFYDFTSAIAVYGGPTVVKAYGDWRADAAQNDGEKALTKIGAIIREMRSDLGESNSGVDANDLIGLFIIGGKEEIEKSVQE